MLEHFMKIAVVTFLCLVLVACAKTPANAPALPVVDNATRTVIEDYLVTTIGVTAYGGKVFCPFTILGSEETQDGLTVYL